MKDESLSVDDRSHRKFAIIENDNGMTVVLIENGKSTEETATKYQGVVIDSGPFSSFEDAHDALSELMEPDTEAYRRPTGAWPAG